MVFCHKVAILLKVFLNLNVFKYILLSTDSCFIASEQVNGSSLKMSHFEISKSSTMDSRSMIFTDSSPSSVRKFDPEMVSISSEITSIDFQRTVTLPHIPLRNLDEDGRSISTQSLTSVGSQVSRTSVLSKLFRKKKARSPSVGDLLQPPEVDTRRISDAYRLQIERDGSPIHLRDSQTVASRQWAYISSQLVWMRNASLQQCVTHVTCTSAWHDNHCGFHPTCGPYVGWKPQMYPGVYYYNYYTITVVHIIWLCLLLRYQFLPNIIQRVYCQPIWRGYTRKLRQEPNSTEREYRQMRGNYGHVYVLNFSSHVWQITRPRTRHRKCLVWRCRPDSRSVRGLTSVPENGRARIGSATPD